MNGQNRPPPELGIYLNDHVAGATAGTELARRLATSHKRPELDAPLRRLADEIAEDRQALVEMTRALGFSPRSYKAGMGLLTERLGRLKTNGRLIRRSSLSTLLELEMLRLGVEGKNAAWRSLLSVAADVPAVDVERLERLQERARRQITVLEELRIEEAARVLSR